jgi:dienelactone hydrolase
MIDLKRLIFSLLLLLAAPASLMAQSIRIKMETRTFSIIGKDTLKLDAYYKEASTPMAQSARPMLVHIHGGGFVGGSRINAAQEVFCRYMAEHDWLVINVDYRLAGIRVNKDKTIHNPYHVDGTVTAIRMACADVISAINYAIEQKDWNANPKTVCLVGGSAGACTSLQLEYDICNDIPYTHELNDSVQMKGIIAQSGCISLKSDTLVWKKKPCPIMSFHGDLDYLIPDRTSKDWAPELQADCTFFGPAYYLKQCEEMGVPYWKWTEWGSDHVMAMKPLTNYLEEQFRFLNDFCIKGLVSSVTTDVRDKEPANMKDVQAMVKYVPLYILGYGKYLNEIDWNNLEKPKGIVY